MAVDLKKMSFGQLLAIGAGVFVVLMILAGFVISSMKKPPAKVVTSRPASTFESSAVDVAIEQIRGDIKKLNDRLTANETATQTAFTTTASGIDQQSANVATLDHNIKSVASRVGNLERSRIGTRVVVVKPEEQVTRPTRRERIAATGERQQLGLTSTSGYAVQATVGNRAWVRSGNEEISVREGETIPLSGPLVVKRVSPGGAVSVGIESPR